MQKTLMNSVMMMMAMVWAHNGFSFDKAKFESLAVKTIQMAIKGEVTDIDAAIADQLEMLAIGITGCKELEPTAAGEEKKLMQLIINEADGIKQLDLDAIEEQWHEGKKQKEAGVHLNENQHMGKANSLADTVIHPATTYIALKKYKSTTSAEEKKELLKRVVDELKEVLEHIKHI